MINWQKVQTPKKQRNGDPENKNEDRKRKYQKGGKTY